MTLCLFALAPSAHAGYWLFSAIGSGAAHDTHPPATGEPKTYSPWIIPAPTVGSFSVPQFGTSNGYDSQADASITLTVKATWTHGTGETDANDPAPPSVWLVESSEAEFIASTATGTGNANDGLGDVVSAGTTGKATSSFGTTKPPAHWTNVTVSGGVAALTARTLSATANFPANPSSPYGGSCSAYINKYSVSVHAQPYNFQKVVGGGSVMPDGTLIFQYNWLSTSGSKADLASCYWHEYVTYPGTVGPITNPNKYYPPNPPFYTVIGVNWLANPYVNPGPGSKGGPMTGENNKVLDTQGVPAFTAPSTYTSGTFTATQIFQFDDTATGQSNVQIPGPDSGPFSIVRTFNPYDAHNYRYLISKDGHSSSVLKPF